MHSYTYMYIERAQKGGKKWGHVKIIEPEDETHKHKYCKFVAGASCIRKHFLHIYPACGEVKCTGAEALLQPVLDEMRAQAYQC